MSLQEVEQFVQRYQAAFNALDGDAVADLWHSPSGIADERAGQGL
ncbi:Cif family virulence factor [Ideonella paludis]